MITESEHGDHFIRLKNACNRALSSDNLSDIKRTFLGIMNEMPKGDDVLYRAISDDMGHLIKSRSLERARHYSLSILRDIEAATTGNSNEFNFRLWKGYTDIRTDSLWLLGRRESESGQKAWYWGNFVPQIPRQMMMRYTKPGSWVLDPFCGSGTTLIEAARLGRNALGIEINPDVYERVQQTLSVENSESSGILLINGDSINVDFKDIMRHHQIDGFDLALLHPPYWDIIKFSDSPRDLSNASTLETFLEMFKTVAEKTIDVLNDDGYMALVIGDAYRNGEIIPLGFRCMDIVNRMGLITKGIIVKDIQNNRGKRNTENLWRYRALKSGFYIFKHEYIFVFIKTGKTKNGNSH